MGLASFMIIKRSLGVEGIGAVAGIAVDEDEEAADGALLFVHVMIKFSIHACCSRVNTSMGALPGLC